jgi:hypothetical protein
VPEVRGKSVARERRHAGRDARQTFDQALTHWGELVGATGTSGMMIRVPDYRCRFSD